MTTQRSLRSLLKGIALLVVVFLLFAEFGTELGAPEILAPRLQTALNRSLH
jgi:purine-cytosine permease-like protein